MSKGAIRALLGCTITIAAAVLGAVVFVPAAHAASVILSEAGDMSQRSSFGAGNLAGETFVLPQTALITRIQAALAVGYSSCAGGVRMHIFQLLDPSGDPTQGGTLIASSASVVPTSFGAGLHNFDFAAPLLVSAGTWYLWGISPVNPNDFSCQYALWGGTTGSSGEPWWAYGDVAAALTSGTLDSLTFVNVQYLADNAQIIFGETEMPLTGDGAQLRSDGATAIPEEGITPEDTVTIRAVVFTPLATQVKLEVEIRERSQPFTGAPDGIAESAFVDSGTVVSVSRSGLLPARYHWRARAVDALGHASDWQEFGTAGNTDVIVGITKSFVSSPLVSQTEIQDGVGAGFITAITGQTFVPPTEGLLTHIDAKLFTGFASCPGGVHMGLWQLSSVTDDPRAGALLLATSTNSVDPTAGSPATFSFLFNRVPVSNAHYYFWGVYTDDAQCQFSIWGAQGDIIHGSAWQLNGFSSRPDLGSPTTTINGVSHNPLSNSVVDLYEVIHAESAAREPVIIVPGIMGTRLNRVSDGEEVWPDVLSMGIPGPDNYLNDLKLDSDGNETSIMRMNATSVIDKELTKVFYKNLIDSFIALGYEEGTNLFLVPYDWRLDVSTSTKKLDDAVSAAIANSPSGKANIIAHSMGGLLLKEYIRQQGNSDFLNKAVLLGVPQLGAPKAFNLLNYGDDMGLREFLFFGLNKDKAKEIAQNMPAVYELLPTRRYMEINPIFKLPAPELSYVVDFRNGAQNYFDYDETAGFMTSNPADQRNNGLLSRADAFHQSLDANALTGPNIYTVAACGNGDTIGTFELYNGNKVKIITAPGDGTVPLPSAVFASPLFLPSSPNLFYVSDETIDHTGLVMNQKTIDLVHGILNDVITTSTLAVLPGISRDPQTCPSTLRTVFSTHSPVELHVYDSNSLHTGPANGAVEENIPNSTYTTVGENSFVFVPSGQTYRVVIDALSSGKFDLEIREKSGSVVESTVTYLNVPLVGPQTAAELNFTDAQSAPNLSVDVDGDATFETVIPPTAILEEVSSADITPPTITILSPTSTDYVRSRTVPVNVAVTDAESGVAFTETRLDGTITTSTVLDFFFGTLGDHVLSVDSSDRAGNPASASTSFRVIATLQSTIADTERARSLGWITGKDFIDKFIAKLKYLASFEKFQTLFNRYKKIIVPELMKFLDYYHARGKVNDQAYTILREDLEWLLNH